MKFAEELFANSIPEWRTQYLQYELMKTMIYEMLNDCKLSAEHERATLMLEKDKTFFKFCKEEFMKIDSFCKQKIAEAEAINTGLDRELNLIVSYMDSISSTSPKSKNYELKSSSIRKKKSKQVKDMTEMKTEKQLKSDYAELYLKLRLLQDYQQINRVGLRKILKKHDKALGMKRGDKWFKVNVELETSPFVSNDHLITTMITNIEDTVTEKLERGNRQKAMKRLHVPPIKTTINFWTTFFLGLTSFGTILLSIFIAYRSSSRLDQPRWVGVRLFRGWALLFAHVFLLGVNMYYWQKNGINHVLIFEMNPRDRLTYQDIMLISSTYLMVWAIFVLGFVYSDALGIPTAALPIIFIFVCSLILFQPFPCFYRSARFWFVKHVVNCFKAPFINVIFADFWMADQMVSLVTFFLDFEYTICFYIFYVDWHSDMSIIVKNMTDEFPHFNESMNSIGINPKTGADRCVSNAYGIRPIVSCIPILIRIMQSSRRFRDTKKKRHLANAGKYSTTLLIVLFGTLNSLHRVHHGDNAFFWIWILAYLVSFCYTFYWDVKMDWGLFDSNAKVNKYLRDELMYGQKYWYYTAIIFDFVFRWSFLVNVSTGDAWLDDIDLLITITTLLECFRRSVWNLFRLENEQINNCGEFRETRHIYITPINQTNLEEASYFEG